MAHMNVVSECLPWTSSQEGLIKAGNQNIVELYYTLLNYYILLFSGSVEFSTLCPRYAWYVISNAIKYGSSSHGTVHVGML